MGLNPCFSETMYPMYSWAVIVSIRELIIKSVFSFFSIFPCTLLVFLGVLYAFAWDNALDGTSENQKYNKKIRLFLLSDFSVYAFLKLENIRVDVPISD